MRNSSFARGPANGKFCKAVPTPDITARLSISGQLLVRSGIEIDRILGSMVEDGVTVTARLPSRQLFLSRLLSADPVKRYIRLGYCDHKAANSELLSAPSVVLGCHHRGAQFAFSCAKPRPTVHGRDPAIELGLPEAMLAVQERRAAKRMQVPLQADVRCKLRLGLLSFDARLVDIGLDGTGFLLAEEALPICAGTRLEGVRVFHPRRDALSVDVDVRYVIPVVLGQYERGTRIGCRVHAEPEVLEELIRLFIIDLQ